MLPRAAKWSLIAALLSFLFSRTALSIVDLDLWHELALALEIVQTGRVPWQDHFAYTPKLELVVHHEWGAGLVAYALTRAFGATGILVAKFALIFGLAATCWFVARRRGAALLPAGIVCALAIVLADYSFATIRAQMYSYLFSALLLGWFDLDRRGNRRWLIGLCVLFPVWVNLHGGCLVGAGMIAAHWFEQLLRRQPHRHLLAAGLSLIPLALLNPWGWHYHAYLWRAITMPRPRIAEWASLWAAGEQHHLLAFGVSVLLAWLVLRQGRWRQFPGIILLAATGLAALKSHRFLVFYATVFACYLPGTLSRIDLGKDLRRWWCRFQKPLATCLAGAAIGLMAQGIASAPWRLHVPSHPLPGAGEHVVYPVGATNYLAEQRFRGNVFVPYDWGSYVMWKLGPAVQISFDSRYEVAYPDWRLEEDHDFFNARGDWPAVLTKYPTDIVLVPNRLRVANELTQVEGWRCIYRDAQFTMFARPGLDLPVYESETDPPPGRFP